MWRKAEAPQPGGRCRLKGASPACAVTSASSCRASCIADLPQLLTNWHGQGSLVNAGSCCAYGLPPIPQSTDSMRPTKSVSFLLFPFPLFGFLFLPFFFFSLYVFFPFFLPCMNQWLSDLFRGLALKSNLQLTAHITCLSLLITVRASFLQVFNGRITALLLSSK